MSHSKPEDRRPFPERVLALYNSCLRRNPLLTKCCTCAFISLVGDVVGQKMHAQAAYDLRKTIAFTLFGLVGTGPITHVFYKQLALALPARLKYSQAYKLILERIVFAPLFLLLFFYAIPILQGKGIRLAHEKVKEAYWPALKANWKFWTAFQYFNLNYIPVQYQAIAASLFALLWNIYLSIKQS